jgi:hypothetical protein
MKHFYVILLLLFIAAGCSNNNPQGRVSISGEVSLDGQPLLQENITFTSQPGLSPLVVTGAPIENGKFSLPKENGLIPGQEYLVQFRSVEEVPGTQKETGNPMMPTTVSTRDIIPPKYGTESKETITVEKGKKNALRFELKSK